MTNVPQKLVSFLFGFILDCEIAKVSPLWWRSEIRKINNQSQTTDSNVMIIIRKVKNVWIQLGSSLHVFIVTYRFGYVLCLEKMYLYGNIYLMYLITHIHYTVHRLVSEKELSNVVRSARDELGGRRVRWSIRSHKRCWCSSNHLVISRIIYKL